MKKIWIASLFLCCAPLSTKTLAVADEQVAEQDGLGIELESLISEKGTFRLEFTTTFSASQSDGIAALFQSVQTGPGTFVTLPVEVGATNNSTHTALGSVALRYGLTERTEVFARATARASTSSFVDNITSMSERLSGASFQSLVFGVNHRFIDEGDTPGLIGFADVSVLENIASSGSDFVFARSGTIGFTTYKVIDPVVISFTGGYRANLSRNVGIDAVDPGDSIFFNPSIAFAVNNELTLTGGVGINGTMSDKVNGTRLGSFQTDAELQFGAAYAWNPDTTLRADVRAEVLGDGNVTFGLSLTRKLGKKSSNKER